MKLGKSQIAGAVAASIMLAGCAGAGSDAAGAAGGVLSGGAAAAQYSQMASTDIALAAGAIQVALNAGLAGYAAEWANAATGNSGSVTGGTVTVTPAGVFCRTYEERFVMGGAPASRQGSACRSPTGAWR